MTQGGLRVQGWKAGANGEVTTGPLSDVRLDLSQTSDPVRTDAISVTGNLSAERLAGPGEPVTMSSVIYDGTGQAHTVVVTVEKTNDGDAAATPPTEDEWAVTGAEIAGDPNATPPVPPTALTVANDTLSFDADGTLTSGGDVALSGTYPDGSALAIDFDMATVTQFGGSTTTSVADQNGAPAGDLVDYRFDQAGRLLLSFTNGARVTTAQLALGAVSNPDGLDQIGDGFYSTTAASGGVRIGRGGAEVSANVISGALETSNVDLAEEFTDMIVAQRGYQANARVITTSGRAAPGDGPAQALTVSPRGGGGPAAPGRGASGPPAVWAGRSGLIVRRGASVPDLHPDPGEEGGEVGEDGKGDHPVPSVEPERGREDHDVERPPRERRRDRPAPCGSAESAAGEPPVKRAEHEKREGRPQREVDQGRQDVHHPARPWPREPEAEDGRPTQ